MHNFGNVVRFEVVRTLKKPSFWLSLFSIPVLFGVIAGIVYFSNTTSQQAEEAANNQKFSFAVYDESSLISPELVSAAKGKMANDKDTAIASVRTNTIAALFIYPADISQQPITIYHQNDGLIENSKYSTLAKALLTQSIQHEVSPQMRSILAGEIQTKATIYTDGEEVNIFAQIIPPVFFLILFYTVILLLGNQMLTTTTEEKENRVTEMLLTSLSSRTLIIAKITALILLGAIQILVVAAVPLLLYMFGRDALSIPDVSPLLSTLEFDPFKILIAAAMLVSGLGLFTGFLVAIGAATPTAKEANSFFGFVILIMMVPFYFIAMLITKTSNIAVDALTFFPLTAPFTVMIRNAFDTISTTDALIALGIVTVGAVIALGLAIRIFRYGTLEYSSRLSFKTIIKKS